MTSQQAARGYVKRGLRMTALLTCLGLAGLAGCSSGNEPAPLEAEVFTLARGAIANRTAERPERPPLRRADLDPLEGSFMEVTLDRSDQFAYLFVNLEHEDPELGRIMVWRTEDNITLTTRNGVLVATRGLGGDVISSDVRVSGHRPGPVSGGAHVQMIRDLDNRLARLDMACEMTDLGAETVVIVERRHPTRHLRQVCTGGGGEIVNDYWVDEAEGLIWQSRQWAGPHIGYLKFRRLTN